MKLLRILFKVGFLKLSTYKEATLVNFIAAIVYIIIQFGVWKAIISSNQSIEYSFTQMFSYIVYSQIIMNIYPSSLGRQLGNMIRSGDISSALLRPISLVKQLVYENFGVSVYRTVFISSPILIVGFFMARGNLCHENILMFTIILICGYCLFVCIDLMFGLLQFYTYSSWGVNSLKYAIIMLCSGKALPLSVYPKWGQSILNILPFKYLYDVPISIILGANSLNVERICIEGGIWMIVAVIAFRFLYRQAIKHVSIMGG